MADSFMEITPPNAALEETPAESIQGGLPERIAPTAQRPIQAPSAHAPAPESAPQIPSHGRVLSAVVPDQYKTSHLESFQITEDREVIEEKESAEVSEAASRDASPKTLSEAHAALLAVQASQPKDKFEAKVKAAKITRLAAIIHELGQGPKSPPMDLGDFLKRTPPDEALAYVAGQYPKRKSAKI